ncbi:MAG: hypothetical protein KDB03_03215 [Planctomycetales bacterium]|nr:hypothetical protein [Planctomycetales bacterium]
MLDNFLAVATSIIVFALFQVANTPMPRGDRSVGYSFLLILLCLLFVICSGLLAVTLAWHKRFGGPHSNIVWQNTAIASGWLALSLATLAGVAFLVEWHAGDFPVTLRWLSQTQVFVWLPALFLFPVFWQVNFGRPDQSLPPLMRLLTGAGFLISIGMCCMLLWGWWHMTVQRHSEMANRIFERNEKRFNENLQFIAEQPDDGPLVNLLSLAGKFQEREVRDAAVAKIKTNPDWEQELIQLLTNSSFQSEVYDFMDGNLVDHPNDFVGPMKTSLKRTAEAIQLEISNSSHLQPWSMEHFGIERCLRAIDQQFVHLPKAEFREEVQAIQRALQRSDTAKVPRFSTLIAVDTWLQVHP